MLKILNIKGFTLVELMVALALSSIIATALAAVYTGQQRVNQSQDQIVEMQQNLRAGLEMMARELRMAGYDPDKKWGTGFNAPSSSTSNNIPLVDFTIVANDDGIDNDGDSTIDEDGEIKRIQYVFFDGYGDGDMNGDGVVSCGNGIDLCDIGRQVGNDPASNRVLIENVERVEFLYTLVGPLPPLSPPPPTLTPSPADFNNDTIRSISISVLVRASGISRGYTNSETYTTAFGAQWPIVPNNNNELYRRRMQIIQVNCRNMGW